MSRERQSQPTRTASRLLTAFDDLYLDLRFAARTMKQSPRLTWVAVTCLGLGIAVATATFSIADSALLRPMAVANPERLIIVNRGEDSRASTYPEFRELRARSQSVAGLAAAFPMESDIDVDGGSEFVVAEVVSANYGEVLGLGLVLGRWFVGDDEPSAVISYDIWQRRFNLSPDLIGKQIISQSQSYTIVGVAPREFTGIFNPLRTDIWVPIRTRRSLLAQMEAPGGRMKVMQFGRLRPGTSAGEVSAELNAMDAHLSTGHGTSTEARVPLVADVVRGIPDRSLRKRAQDITALLGIVAVLIFLIGCINVGNLLMTRAMVRQREVGIRLALGATPGRLRRQLLAESFALAIVSGACGLMLAAGTIRVLTMSMPPLFGSFAMDLKLSIDWRAFGFAVIVSLAASVVCGVLPALGLSRGRRLVFQRELVPGLTRRFPFGLVAQVVMSLVLLLVAGSFLQAILRVQRADPGFDVERRLFAYTFVPTLPSTLESRQQLYAQAQERVRALPGVQSVALASTIPLMPIGSDCASLASGSQIRMTTSAVSAGYFEAMGIDLISGRDFTPMDLSATQPPVILNEGLATRLWPNGGAVGSLVTIGCQSMHRALVVGVVRDSAIKALDEPRQPHAYQLLTAQSAPGLTVVVVKASSDPATLVEPFRRSLLDVGRGLRVFTTQSLRTHVEQRYAPDRWLVGILIGFAALALALAAVGLYAIIAYRVILRTPEFGVRMALGATRNDVFRGVITQGLTIVLAAVIISEMLAAGAVGLVGWIQQGIGNISLATHVGVWLIWMAVAFAACYLPAARAARVDPLVALRHE